jgi:thymidylate synthase, flavin-dependent
VTLIALTAVDYDAAWEVSKQRWKYNHGFAADDLAEFAGRNCYQSWDNPANRTNKEYIGNILDKMHFSVLEHACVTFHIAGISRSLSHEFVRHRHFSYSQLSQRYVDEKDSPIILPPAIAKLGDPDLMLLYDDSEKQARNAYPLAVEILMERYGYNRKDARSAARALFPNMWSTQIVVTGNHRSWREFLDKRLSPAADDEIRELAQIIVKQLKKVAPSTYQDMA